MESWTQVTQTPWTQILQGSPAIPSEAVRSAVANDAPNIVQLLATWRVTRKRQGVDSVDIELWMTLNVYQSIPCAVARFLQQKIQESPDKIHGTAHP